MNINRSRACLLVLLLAACSNPSPTQPSAARATLIVLEGEAGSGDGQVVQRSRASGGQTVHLGPGELRRWSFAVIAAQPRYDLSVTYSNGKGRENEIISVGVDGRAISAFQNRDSDDSTEAWNVFVTDPAGTSTLFPGNHTLTLAVSGGDGCVEIDVVTLTPPILP